MNIDDDVEMWFMYDDNGPLVIKYGNAESHKVYHYELNLQGDVIAIISTTGERVVEYTYDAWGNVLSITGSAANTIGVNNPLRYRGYIYDPETSLYYCQSRYYNPEVGRWLNADAFASTGQGLLGNNMFAYCNNCPVRYVDSDGRQPEEVLVTDDRQAELFPNPDGYAPVNTGQAPRPASGSSSIHGNSSNGSTTIYRYGGTNPGNLVPRGSDVVSNSGLSFSTQYRPGSAATTIDLVNGTGVLFAIQDGVTHVSVYPIGGTMYDWYRAGRYSEWSTALRGIVTKVR